MIAGKSATGTNSRRARQHHRLYLRFHPWRSADGDRAGPDDGRRPAPDALFLHAHQRALSDHKLASDGRSAGPMPTVTAIWLNRVREGGTWDYKLQPGGSQQLGNLNFGATGTMVLPLDIIRRGAGFVQDPKSKGPGHWTDRAPSDYGDQRADTPAIVQGAAQCKGTR